MEFWGRNPRSLSKHASNKELSEHYTKLIGVYRVLKDNELLSQFPKP